MDESQKNHLKAYGITYWTLTRNIEVEWLLNYRGGSFMIPDISEIESGTNEGKRTDMQIKKGI